MRPVAEKAAYALNQRRLVLVSLFVFLWSVTPARAEDWPMYRHDRLRTAVTGEKLSLPLEQVWAFKSRQSKVAPRPDYDPNFSAYPGSVRDNLPLIAVGDAVFFTSAEDGRLVCLDAGSGAIRWQFIAGAGMNRSPTYWEGRVYAGSSDGNVYCLDARSGAVSWIYRAAPADRCLLSYGKMISVWPVMTDVFVDGGVAYCAAGTFPHDGAFLDALDAKTGRQIWRSGRAGENAWRESLSPGGHLYVTQNNVWVPKDFRGFGGIAYGSGVPFRRSDGRFIGGWGDPDVEKPKTTGMFWPLMGVVKDGVRYSGVAAWKVEGEETKREMIWQQDIPGRWTDTDSAIGMRVSHKRGQLILRYDPDLSSVVYAGGTLFHSSFDADPKKGVGSGVYARDPKTGEALWTAEIPERANQIVVANGHLLVGTRSGTIYCFASTGAAKHGLIEEQIQAPAAPGKDVAIAAEQIIKQAGVQEGHALVLDCHDGRLAAELARRTKLFVCAVFRDAEAMQKARETYVAAGLHLTRIVTWHQSPGTKLPYSSFFADLIVSEGSVAGKSLPEDVDEIIRLSKPIRGVTLLGGISTQDPLKQWIASTKLQGWEIVHAGGFWARRIRPPLADAGGWTHMYGDPGQSSCSHDGVLKPPLGVVWFGPPFMVNGSRQTALIVNGILVNPDAHSLEGYDQYTGRRLWRIEAANVAAGEGQVAVSPKHVFIRHPAGLVQLDLLTGKELATFRTPFGEKNEWEWFAVSDDGSTVFGASGGGLFALEVESGKSKLKWQIGGPDAPEKIGGRTVMSDGRIYLLAGAASEAQRAEVIEDLRKWFQTQTAELRDEFEKQVKDRDIRELIAVTAATGKILYRRGVDITNCGGSWLRPVNSGGKRGYSPHLTGDLYTHNGVVVFGSSGGADKGWGVWNGGGYKSRALTAYEGATGKLLWYRYANYRARPVIVDDTIYAEPWAYDLRTGASKTRKHPISGEDTDWAWCRSDKQCGIFSASKYFLFGRSMGVGYQDLLTDQGLYTFWHSRSSCWMDCSSGGGIMFKPPQSIGCICQWNMPFSIALGQVSTQPTAAPVTAAPGPALPVRHLHLDFGATGDHRDAAGNLWVRANLPKEHLLFLSYPMTMEFYDKHDQIQRSTIYTPIEDAQVPFVFATAQIGLKRCTLPITKDGKGKGRFQVRLGFAALPGEKPGQRVFDVKLNGKTVIEDFDAAKEAGRADRALWKQFTIDLDGDLILELAAKSGTDDLARLPAINALEVLRLEGKGSK